MILLNCATRILGGDQSPQYNKDIKILQESESQWEDKLTPEIVCEIIPIILNNLANQGNDNVDFTLFEHHYNFCRGANVDSYSIFLRSWAEL